MPPLTRLPRLRVQYQQAAFALPDMTSLSSVRAPVTTFSTLEASTRPAQSEYASRCSNTKATMHTTSSCSRWGTEYDTLVLKETPFYSRHVSNDA